MCDAKIYNFIGLNFSMNSLKLQVDSPLKKETLWFSNALIFATKSQRPLICQTINSARSSLKYQWFTPSDCKDIGIKKFELVAKFYIFHYYCHQRNWNTKFSIFNVFMYRANSTNWVSVHWSLANWESNWHLSFPKFSECM